MLQALVFGNQLAIGDTVICRWSQHLSLLIVTIKTKHNMDVTVIDSTGPVGHSRWLWWGPEFPVLSGLAFQISFLCVPQVTGRCFYMQHCLVDERKKNSVCSLSLLPFIREYKISFGCVFNMQKFDVPTNPLGENELSSIREELATFLLSQVIIKKGEFYCANPSSLI